MPDSEVPAGGTGEIPDLDAEQALADRDQTLADSDQTLADADQTSVDRDELASERDQRASDSDQRSADQDHAARDPDIDDKSYNQSRRRRFQSTLERDLSTEARSESARLRDLNADQRDEVATARDLAAEERDELLSRLDRREERDAETLKAGGEGERAVGIELLLRAARDRQRAAALRERVRDLRQAAARDRSDAANDRRRAALDRRAAADELALQGLDHLTGSLRRRSGLDAIQRELDRTARSGESVVIAFLDVDRLKAVNDTLGHEAGDELLRTVIECLRNDLRSYDFVVRYGGDEFVCSMSGQTEPEVHSRFEHVAAAVAEAIPGASFSVGIAARRPEETLDRLVARADEAMLAGRAARGHDTG